MFICLCLLSFSTHIFSCAHSGFNKFCRLCRKLKYINIQLQFWPLPTISYSDIKNVGSGRDFGGALFCVCEHGQFPDICGFTICILLQLFLAFRVFHKFGRHEFCYEKWTSCPGCNADLNRVNDNVCWSLNSNVLYGACLSRQDNDWFYIRRHGNGCVMLRLNDDWLARSQEVGIQFLREYFLGFGKFF